jgi:hypothetical protein
MHWTGTLKVQRRGIAKETWKRTREWELQRAGENWKAAKALTLDRTKLKNFKKALCLTQKEQKE